MRPDVHNTLTSVLDSGGRWYEQSADDQVAMANGAFIVGSKNIASDDWDDVQRARSSQQLNAEQEL